MSNWTNNQDQPGSSELTIPLDSRVLGDFISGLLGQSRTMERRFSDRRFEIDTAWLLNLDQVIDQRLASQNQGKLVSFSARFYFANGKMIILEDHTAFRTFHDMSNELSVGVDLRWTYLIKFPLVKLPEKQEIRFSAFTDKDIAEQRKKERKQDKSFLSAGEDSESISISIHFTDVTWGEDLYSHIGNYILAKTETMRRWKRFARKIKSSSLFPLSVAIGMAVAMGSIYAEVNAGRDRITQKFGSFDNLKLSTIDEKLDLIVHLTMARANVEVFPVLPLIRGAIFIVVAWGLYFLATARRASFININDYSDQYLKKYGKNYDFITYGVFAALIVGIIGGVFSNRLYDLSKGWW